MSESKGDLVPIDDQLGGQLAERLRQLSPTQRGRLEAFIAGDGTSAIAHREGVSPQAVHETLRSSRVRNVLHIVGEHFVDDDTLQRPDGTTGSIIDAIVENLVKIALGATRSDGSKSVPDYRVRLDASNRLLQLMMEAAKYGVPAEPQHPAVPDDGTATDEIIARERTTVSRTREVRRRRRGGQEATP